MCLPSFTSRHVFVVWFENLCKNETKTSACRERQSWCSLHFEVFVSFLQWFLCLMTKMWRDIKLWIHIQPCPDLYITQWNKIHDSKTCFWTRHRCENMVVGIQGSLGHNSELFGFQLYLLTSHGRQYINWFWRAVVNQHLSYLCTKYSFGSLSYTLNMNLPHWANRRNYRSCPLNVKGEATYNCIDKIRLQSHYVCDVFSLYIGLSLCLPDMSYEVTLALKWMSCGYENIQFCNSRTG